MTLEDLKPNSHVAIDGKTVTITGIESFGEGIANVQYRTAEGRLSEEIFYRHDESRFQPVTVGRPWQFDGNGEHFRLVSEAQRIQLAHLFDPLLAVHTSLIEPLPHQITAVYEAMLPRQPLRFLLADDPGAGKTIMAGLLIKELMARGDVKRCLVVCPGSLAEQWQDELYRKFQLPFEILTNDKLEAARTGNWFLENDLTIARLDKLSRNEDVQDKLAADGCHYDLIICDEAHKMSATLAGKEIKYTKRYLLGEKLSTLTRHFLLMTATPHNGKEADFQLFLKLLDGDRFEGRFRTGVHKVDTTDLMRRMVKETLLKFDGRPLFPERRAYTVPYQLSDAEAALYKSVTEYVTNEFNRVDRLDGKRRVTVGFALTILQRRLASSPGAIHASLRRRRERLEARLEELLQRRHTTFDDLELDEDDIEGIEDATDEGFEQAEDDVLDQATAASSIQELQLEIETLQKLEDQAAAVKRNGSDAKWRELSSLINAIFQTGTGADVSGYALPPDVPSPKQKLVIFTEHRDTLAYLEQQITTLLGDPESVVVIHGGVKRDRRRAIQEKFLYDPSVKIFLANDAAGEGINLQRAHLMVNYDLPWNPNRLEQRFGRIHRIGQKDVCYLWNLIASGTREGDVFQRLLDKLEQARRSLSGQVFDVLGKLQFDGKPLRDLLIEAVRYGESPEVRDRLNQVIDEGTGQAHLQELLENKALVEDAMDASRVAEIREDMARADARRLQPHYIEAFFLAAFKQLGGKVREREARPLPNQQRTRTHPRSSAPRCNR